MSAFNPLDWASVGVTESDSSSAWAKLFDDLAEHGFEACSASIMSFDNFVLPAETHGTMVSHQFEGHIRANPGITQSLDVMRTFAAGDDIIAANCLHPDYARWSEYDRNYIHLMEEFGFRGGMAASVHDPMRAEFVFFTGSCLTHGEEAAQSFDRIAPSLLPAITFLQEGIRVREMAQEKDFVPLSNRERECLVWVCSGLMTGGIAERTNLAESTVQEYLRNACRKLQSRTRAQAAARATLLSMIEP